MRLQITFQDNGNMAKVYRDAEWQEFRVKFYSNGKHQTEGDYHTEDRQDAISTAKYILARMEYTVQATAPTTKPANPFLRDFEAMLNEVRWEIEAELSEDSDSLQPLDFTNALYL